MILHLIFTWQDPIKPDDAAGVGWGWGHRGHRGLSHWCHPSQTFHCVAPAATPEGSALNCGNPLLQPTPNEPLYPLLPSKNDPKKTDVRRRHRGSSRLRRLGFNLGGIWRESRGLALRPPPWRGSGDDRRTLAFKGSATNAAAAILGLDGFQPEADASPTRWGV